MRKSSPSRTLVKCHVAPDNADRRSTFERRCMSTAASRKLFREVSLECQFRPRTANRAFWKAKSVPLPHPRTNFFDTFAQRPATLSTTTTAVYRNDPIVSSSNRNTASIHLPHLAHAHTIYRYREKKKKEKKKNCHNACNLER